MKRLAVILVVCGCISTVERAPKVEKSMRLETASLMREALKVNSQYEDRLLRYLNFNRKSASDVLTEVWRRSRLRWRPYNAATNRQIASVQVRAMMGDVHADEAMMVLQSIFEMNAVPMELVPSRLGGVYVRMMQAGGAKAARPLAPTRPPQRPTYNRPPPAGYYMYDPWSRR